jgi:uncharacterized protein (TIGR02594 family)
MVQLHAFRRVLRAVFVCFITLASVSTAMVASSSPASARSRHHITRRFHVHYVRRYHAHYARRYHGHYGRYLAYRHYRHVTRLSRWDAGVAHMRAGGFANAHASIAPDYSVPGAPAANRFASSSYGSSDLVTEARRYLGGNPTGRSSLWCARFMNLVLQRSGHRGTGSDLASSFAHYGTRVSGPQVGAIAVMGRRGGGHVGIITGIDASGNPIMISGNNRNRVREAPISRGRIYAYVMPNG